MSQKSREVMKKLVGIQCRQCQKYFRTTEYLLEHEQKYHYNQYVGTSMAYPTASSFQNYSSTSGYVSRGFSSNPPQQVPSSTPSVQDDDDGWGGSGGGGLGGGGFGGFGGGNSAGGGASGGW